MTVHQQRLKIINFTINGTAFDCQVSSWNCNPNAKAGNQEYTFCAAGEGQNSFYEVTDDQWTLELKFFSDWRVNGISDFLQTNNKQTAAFVLDHHPDIIGEHVQWSGNLMVMSPSIGGDSRITESQDITMPIIGIPTYLRIG
jgi:hypothetical protein